jgi:regulator of protease activity HflC (stomatin/prohibitin superfamily)
MKKTLIIAVTAATISTLLLLSNCTRIESGEVGLRVGFDKIINPNELHPGSFNQTLIGSVLKFPIKELAVKVENKTPLTLDNTTISDFDLSLVYSINQNSVSELWSQKSKAFHYRNEDGEYFLMQNYIETLASNAVFKAVREYKALDLADNRANIEQAIKKLVVATLNDEKLGNAITISLVQIKNITLSPEIVQSANAVITAQNALKTKEIEVQTAKQEALRIEALNANSKAIEYMNAQSQMLVAQGIKDGKVNTVIVPYDFKGMINIK